MNPVFIDAIGLVAPGLSSWEEGREVLSEKAAFLPEPLARYKPKLLPQNERRRATNLIRLAFQAGENAVNEKDIDVKRLASVFASSGGDYDIIDKICRVLSEPERAVSPTQFHNSVHNSAAGYWSIGTGSHKSSISLSSLDCSFSAGLIESMTFVSVEDVPTLLVSYDIQPPSPLLEKWPINAPFAVALVLSPQKTSQSMAKLTLKLKTGEYQESVASCDDLEQVRMGNPAARSIPLLELLAKQESGSLCFATSGSQYLIVDVHCD